MLWATMVIRIRNNDRRSCAVLSIFTRERVQVCGWEVIVYVSVARKSCASFHVRTDFLRSTADGQHRDVREVAHEFLEENKLGP